jgi:hypothetical protein
MTTLELKPPRLSTLKAIRFSPNSLFCSLFDPTIETTNLKSVHVPTYLKFDPDDEGHLNLKVNVSSTF